VKRPRRKSRSKKRELISDAFLSEFTANGATEVNRDNLLSILSQLVDGSMSVEVAADRLDTGTDSLTASTDDACVDLGRQTRCGFPEVVYGPGKTPEAIVQVFEQLTSAGQPCLATRVDEEQTAALVEAFPAAVANRVARTIRLAGPDDKPASGRVAVVSAGTSDRPVAEEAIETLRWMNCEVDLVQDVGVAGPQRLLQQVARLRLADALVVVAGMEGALPSVVGGHVDVPIFGVPTSVGYGANFGGVSALLSMLNSCAANVAVVNIDAGFKAAYLAGMVARAATST